MQYEIDPKPVTETLYKDVILGPRHVTTTYRGERGKDMKLDANLWLNAKDEA